MESGIVYIFDEIVFLKVVVVEWFVLLYMDGVWFVNVFVIFGCILVEMIWKFGVDVFLFGVMKNGCWCVEVVVFFDFDVV